MALDRLTFKGYERSDGTVGTRNFIGVISTVACANEVVGWVSSHESGVKAFCHGQGCAQTSPDLEVVTRTLISLGQHPNIAAVVLIGLGCESISIDEVAEGISLSGKPVEGITIQEVGGAKRARDIARTKISRLKKDFLPGKRKEVDVSELLVGLKCGGSDTTSGITANPALGRTVDMLVDGGASCVFGETTECIGADDLLAARGCNKNVQREILCTVLEMEGRAKRMGVDMRGGQPTQGNIKGGLSTIEEKSLGAAVKTGSRKIRRVIPYGSRITSKGLFMVDSPGREPEVLTGLVATGAQVVVFTTGRGAPQGFPFAPVIKITGNPKTAKELADHIDVDVSGILAGEETIEQAGCGILEMVMAVASGRRTRAETLGYEGSMNIYVTGPVI
ncbi:MAG: UxaA family hydrolase [Methanomassiliicoccales archaeon]|nr:UxaA family hydrolase [Methanomassiliicoccales archaeon]